MEKNRNIPIDQFFADLRQYETAEPSTTGAWEQMKRLLDNELPEGRQIAGNTFRKRYLLPILLLFIGGTSYLLADRYPLYLRFGSSEESITASNATGRQPTDTDKTPSGQSPVNKNPFSLPAGTLQEDNQATNGLADGKTGTPGLSEDIAGRRALAYAEKVQEDLEGANSRPDVLASNDRSKVVAGRSPDKLSQDPPLPAAGLSMSQPVTSAGSAESREAGIASREHPSSVAGTETSLAGTASSKAGIPSAPITEQNLLERLYPKADNKPEDDGKAMAGAGVSGAKTGVLDSTTSWTPVMANNSEEIVRNNEKGGYFKVDRDTFKRIEKQVTTVSDPEDPSRRDFIVDTLSITRIEKITYYPIAYPSPEFTEKNYAAVFASGSDYALESASQLVPLSSYKVASKKVKPTAFTSLKRTANGLESLFDGEKDWYMAIFAGGHAPLGNPGSLGIQAGIAALYTFRERWVLSAEARFMKTYFPGYKLLDASSNFELNKSQVPGGWLFSGTESVTTHAYNLQLLNSLHVPITLSYNFGRVSAFGGVDLSYSFPLKWDKETSFSSLPVSQLSEDGSNPFLDESFTLNERAAFKSRLGLGYVAGLSYDFSRKLSLDLRIRQTMWDNAHYELDNLKKLYRRPSAELTLGFFFGRREKVIYIMDTHR